MFRPTPTARARRGHILIVTILLLTLFAVVAITVVYDTQGQARWAKINGDAQQTIGFTDDGLSAFNEYLSGFIYDRPDSPEGYLDATRGHSLMATMYGRQPGGTIPWNGTGTFHEQVTAGGAPPFDRVFLVNHRPFFTASLATNPAPGSPKEPPFTPEITSSGAYVPKNAGYTYPDMKDFYLAQIGPNGQIVMSAANPNAPAAISYFRYRDPTVGGFGGLEPGNNNWRNQSGRFLILRPTQFDHPNFPPVPPNADGVTYSGDVQNLPGGVGPQRNDSIWIDIGRPVITLPGGKRIKALVAPLIVDLDSRLNLSAHGNILNAGAHTSGSGLGSWEVNLQKALPAADVQLIMAARGMAQARRRGITAPTDSRPFAPYYVSAAPGGYQFPMYARVAWRGAGGAHSNSLNPPGQGTASLFAGAPDYSAAFEVSNDPAAFPSHPALLNPTEWPDTAIQAGQANRTFPLTDAKRLGSRFAGRPAFYDLLDLGVATPNPISLRGDRTTYIQPFPALVNSASNYRLDPAHMNRLLFTTYGYGLDRPGLMPNYLDVRTGAALTLVPGTPLTGGVLTQPTAALPYPPPAAPGAVSDFAANDWRNTRAALGPLDLNRPLADYRDPANLNLPLSATNIGNLAAAEADRQRLAMAIFARLVVATGALATLDASGNVTLPPGPPPSPEELNALRSLAQLAVNIVDYIDNDDINTRFQWNTAAPTEFVYGVEKPRLVLNEVFSEVVNDPTDMAFTVMNTAPTKDAQVRFWVELVNPTNAAYAPNTGPLGDGSVQVAPASGNPYQIEIVRNAKAGGPPGGVSASLRDPLLSPTSASNVTGTSGVAPDILFDFSMARNTPAATVVPANGNPATPRSTLLIAAEAQNPPTKTPTPEFVPNFTDPTATGASVIQATACPAAIGGTTAMAYPLPLTTAFPVAATMPADELRHHVVLLRRLANPYLPPGPTNPFITVDLVDHVPAADRIILGDQSTTKREAKSPMNATGYDPNTPAAQAGDPDQPRTFGKVQPYASWTDPTQNQPNSTVTFPNTLVVKQQPNPDPGQGVYHTLGRHNGSAAAPPAAVTYTPGNPAGTPPTNGVLSDTLMAPFDWLVHPDRPLMNQTELLHVTAGKPHELTLRFAVPNLPANPTDVTRFANAAPWLTGNSGLYRALDVLRVQPHGHMTALGGRVPGRININTITDKRVWDALFDAQDNINAFNQTMVDQMWTALMQSRAGNRAPVNVFGASGTPPPVYPATAAPGESVYDSPTPVSPTNPLDRPFVSFGSPQVAAQANGFAMRSGVSLDDTIFRLGPAVNPTTPPTPLLMSMLPPTAHPYQQAEAVRKILNNTTTVSHNFAVWVTVGYFEVEDEIDSGIAGANLKFARLGKEYYKDVPGDMRKKFFAIVDRSNVGLIPTTAPIPPGTNLHATTRPFFTTLEAAAGPATNPTQIQIAAAAGGANFAQVYSDGQAVNILGPINNPAPNPPTPGTTLVVGTGADQEIVTVQSVSFDPTRGVAAATVAPALVKNHAAGECVSNVIPGNPGPQPGFKVGDPMYQAVVPHWSRVE